MKNHLLKIVIQYQDNYSYFNGPWTSSQPKFYRHHKKADIALPGGTPPQSYGTSLAMASHSVTCHPTQVNAPCLTQPCRPVLDLPTLGGWKAELT